MVRAQPKWSNVTKARREIRRLQSELKQGVATPLLRLQPTNRLADAMMTEISGGNRKRFLMTKEARRTFQALLLANTSAILESAKIMAIHAKRKTVLGKDILAWRVSCEGAKPIA